MRKIIIRLILCLLIFIGGISYGVKGEANSIKPVGAVDKVEVSETGPVIEVIELEDKPVKETNEYIEADDESIIYQTATLFDKVVSSLYEVGVRLIYQFVNLFFD